MVLQRYIELWDHIRPVKSIRLDKGGRGFGGGGGFGGMEEDGMGDT